MSKGKWVLLGIGVVTGLAIIGALMGGEDKTTDTIVRTAIPTIDTTSWQEQKNPGTAATTIPKPTATPPATTYVLELISSRGYIEYGYFHVTGQVRNISNKPQEHITALVEFALDDGTFVKNEDALIDLNPIMPGETSPFEVLTSWNRPSGKYILKFKYLFGGSILTKK